MSFTFCDIAAKNWGIWRICPIYYAIAIFLLQIRGEPSLQPDIRLGPANLTVGAGDTARLDCRVRSAQMPHIKWLRRLEAGSRIEDDGEIIPVGEDKYRIIASSRYFRF
jgi:hypothetical protein